MVRFRKRLFSLLLALTVLLGAGVCARAVSGDELREALRGSAGYMYSSVPAPRLSSEGGDWAVINLSRCGYEAPQDYWDGYYASVEEAVIERGGVINERRHTENSRVVLALTAIGADASDVAGFNLLLPLGDFGKTMLQGINGASWALLALDSGNYEIPRNPDAEIQATRQMYIDEILSRELSGGGWNLTDIGGGGNADADITAMALQPLAKYQDQPEVAAATERALARLSGLQRDDGGYASYGTPNCESTAQVIIALCELGVSLDDARFVKNGCTALDALLRYRSADGSFSHLDGGGTDQMASQQATRALLSAVRAQEGRSSLYRMDDVDVSVSERDENAFGLPGKHADVKMTEIVRPGLVLSDIEGHENMEAIRALTERAVISGMGDGTYAPDNTMERRQFSVIVVRALGLTPRANDAFTDVPAGEWYAGYVGAAHDYGIVNGRGEGIFDPLGTINRQEAAVMVRKAAELCGLDTQLGDVEIRNILAQFADYMTIDSWAMESMAFCYEAGIYDAADLDAEPLRPILRGEIAQMLYNLLAAAKLV